MDIEKKTPLVPPKYVILNCLAGWVVIPSLAPFKAQCSFLSSSLLDILYLYSICKVLGLLFVSLEWGFWYVVFEALT